MYERELSLGEAAGEERVILSGLKEGDVVVLRPDGIREGSHVVPVE